MNDITQLKEQAMESFRSGQFEQAAEQFQQLYQSYKEQSNLAEAAIALNDRGVPIDQSLIVEGDFTETGGHFAMQQLLALNPDAVFVASDSMAYGALRALRMANLSVPDDVAMVGFDDLPSSTTSDPPLTTMRQPIRRLGTQAVENLIDILENGSRPPRQTIATTQLVIRNSCGASRNNK